MDKITTITCIENTLVNTLYVAHLFSHSQGESEIFLDKDGANWWQDTEVLTSLSYCSDDAQYRPPSSRTKHPNDQHSYCEWNKTAEDTTHNSSSVRAWGFWGGGCPWRWGNTTTRDGTCHWRIVQNPASIHYNVLEWSLGRRLNSCRITEWTDCTTDILMVSEVTGWFDTLWYL